MSDRGWELIASDESTILAEPLLDALVVENGQSDRCLSDSSRTDECNWSQILGETDDPLDQFVTSKTSPRRRGRRFTG